MSTAAPFDWSRGAAADGAQHGLGPGHDVAHDEDETTARIRAREVDRDLAGADHPLCGHKPGLELGGALRDHAGELARVGDRPTRESSHRPPSATAPVM